MENLSAEGEKRVDYENKMQANIETPNKPAINNITDNSAVIDGGSGTEVRIGEGEWHDSPHTFTNLNENTTYTAYSRYKKTETHFASSISEGFNFRTNSYEFTATFTNAGSTGRTGPSQSQLDSAYAGSSLEGIVRSQNGIQLWTVPESGKYRIETYGAQGGGSGRGYSPPGKGAIIKGDVSLTKGETLKVLVGQMGEASNVYSVNGGGGGGTFVTKLNNSPLIVAGGGGGAGQSNSNTHARSSTGNGNGGTATSNSWAGGAGGGFNGNGSSASDYGGGGYSFITGGTGGTAYNGASYGGFGGFGGGGGLGHYGAGGGGGYQGGNGGTHDYYAGWGGYSYNAGTNQANSVDNTGHGKVIITYIGE